MSETAENRSSPLRYTRRLIDHILIAFHHACDQSDFEVAQSLLQVVEFMARRLSTSPDGRERRAKHSLVAAHERLWHLRHPATDHDDMDRGP
jgi:predicted acyl esterase